MHRAGDDDDNDDQNDDNDDDDAEAAQWSKSVDKSDFVGRARTSCFCDQNM